MTNLSNISYKCEYLRRTPIESSISETVSLIDALEMASTGGYHYTFITRDDKKMKIGKTSEDIFATLAAAIPNEILNEQFSCGFNRDLVDADSRLIERITIEKTFNDGIAFGTVLQRDLMRYAKKTPQIFLLSQLAIEGFLRRLRGDV
jgi:hypothetical protein